MNHAGRRKVIGMGNSLSVCSMMVCCVSRFRSLACAPIVDRYTTLPGRAFSSVGFQRGGDLLRLRKTQRRIEVRRNKHKDALRPFESRRKRRGVSDVRYRHFATALCPGITFAAVAHHGSNGPPGSQKVIRYVAANIASDSSYGKHSF
jgi:hypothetical protein